MNHLIPRPWTSWFLLISRPWTTRPPDQTLMVHRSPDSWPQPIDHLIPWSPDRDHLTPPNLPDHGPPDPWPPKEHRTSDALIPQTMDYLTKFPLNRMTDTCENTEQHKSFQWLSWTKKLQSWQTSQSRQLQVTRYIHSACILILLSICLDKGQGN